MTRKKKKTAIKTIKTSIKSILRKNEKGKELLEILHDLLPKLHLLRIGVQQFIHYYVLNYPNGKVITKDSVEAVLTALNGLCPQRMTTETDFGRLYWYLVPIIDRFINDSDAAHLFPPSIGGIENRMHEFVLQNPRPSNWKCKETYEEVVLKILQGKRVLKNKSVLLLKEKIA